MISKATKAEHASAPATIELFSKSGFSGRINGTRDYVHVKTGKRFVCYKVLAVTTPSGVITSISLRKVKATAKTIGSSLSSYQRRLMSAKKARLQRELSTVERQLG